VPLQGEFGRVTGCGLLGEPGFQSRGRKTLSKVNICTFIEEMDCTDLLSELGFIDLGVAQAFVHQLGQVSIFYVKFGIVLQ
jgi:hypothetical protein